MAREFKLWAVSTKEERRAISELTRRRELMLMNAERNVERQRVLNNIAIGNPQPEDSIFVREARARADAAGGAVGDGSKNAKAEGVRLDPKKVCEMKLREIENFMDLIVNRNNPR